MAYIYIIFSFIACCFSNGEFFIYISRYFKVAIILLYLMLMQWGQTQLFRNTLFSPHNDTFDTDVYSFFLLDIIIDRFITKDTR